MSVIKCEMCNSFVECGVKVVYNGTDIVVCKTCFKDYWLK